MDAVRETAERMEVPKGSKVQILRGRIHVTALPVVRHTLVSDQIKRQFSGIRSGGRCAVNGGVAVAPDIGEGDFAIPDLVVTTRDALMVERPMLPAVDVELVAEVVSHESAEKDVEILPELYAEWGFPIYLLVDPRIGEIRLHSAPVAGVYQQNIPFRFGVGVSLPSPLAGFQIDTSEFRAYDPVRD